MNEKQAEKKMKAYFGPALRVVADHNNLDAIVVWSVDEISPGEVVVYLWPSPHQSITVAFPEEFEEADGRWTFPGRGGLWQFRSFPEADAFAKAFRKAQQYA